MKLRIVVWDDEQGLCVPMGWDTDCPGALCAAADNEPVALFHDHAAARKAIRISRAYARLCREQDKTENSDFLEGAMNVKIRRVEFAKGAV